MASRRDVPEGSTSTSIGFQPLQPEAWTVESTKLPNGLRSSDFRVRAHAKHPTRPDNLRPSTTMRFHDTEHHLLSWQRASRRLSLNRIATASSFQP